MINGMTVEEYNAKERLRGSIVAKLHGYIPFNAGDTKESLKAEFSEITGETYRSPEEEQADNVQAAEEQRKERIFAQELSERTLLAEARINGFMDCIEIRNALGWDKPKANGSYYSPMGVAYRWIDDADEEVVYVLPEDGRRITSLTYRSGCWKSAFPHILEVKKKWDADRAAREQKSWDDALAAKNAYDKQQIVELNARIAQQDADRTMRVAKQKERYAQIDAERSAEIQRLIAEAEADDKPHTEAEILDAVRTYPANGPRNQRGYPTGRHLQIHAGFRITRQQKKRACQALALEAEAG